MNRNKKIEIHFAFVLFIVCFVIFFTIPQIKKIKDISNRIEERSSDKIVRSERIGKISKLRSQSDLVANNQDKISPLFSGEDVVSLIEMLEATADASGVQIKIEIEEKNSDDKKNNQKKSESEQAFVADVDAEKTLKAKLYLLGDFVNTVDFMRKIENMKYWSSIYSVRISQSDEFGSGVLQLPSVQQEKNPFYDILRKNTPPGLTTEENVSTNDVVVSVLGIVFYLK